MSRVPATPSAPRAAGPDPRADGAASRASTGDGDDRRAAPDAQRAAIDGRRAAPDERQAEWFDAARRGDRAAFGKLVAALQDRLHNAVYRMVGGRADDALDVTQETFAKALAHIGDCRGDSQPYTWLFRIAMNLAISKRRKDAVRRARSLDAADAPPRDGRWGDDQMSSLRQRLASAGPTPPEAALAAETRDRVRRALDRLDDDERALLVMRDVDGLDYAQMATLLEIPLGTLKSRLFRARMALRTRIEEMEK